MLSYKRLLWATFLTWSFGKALAFSTSSTLTPRPTNFETISRSFRLDIALKAGPKGDSSQRRTVYNHILQHFQGDFDNYRQAVADRKEGLAPRKGGGHENFHCTLVPLSETSRLAAFYFDGNPQRIFRFRYYELALNASSSDNSDDDEGCIEMRLYTLNPDLERELRSYSDEPLKWPAMFHSFDVDESDKIKYLPNCEVRWSIDMDPVEHEYAVDHESELKEQDSIHAVMVHGEAIVDSTVIPGVKIRILDQLSLYEDTFFINDRGLDPESGAFIYGNQRGVPYRLDRLTRLVPNENNNNDNQQWERQIVDEELQWTLGESWRSPEEYDAKVEAMGGLSAVMSGKKPPSPSSDD